MLHDAIMGGLLGAGIIVPLLIYGAWRLRTTPIDTPARGRRGNLAVVRAMARETWAPAD